MADALGLSLAGLDVTNARINTLAQNISNAQSPGYTDKHTSQTVGALGQAVLGPITRNVDEQLQSSLNDAGATVNQLQVNVNLLSQIETSFGSPSADSSLSSTISNLQNAFQDLSVNPEQGALYHSVINAANQVAASLNGLSKTVQSTAQQAVIQTNQTVAQINQTLQSIDKINNQIVAGQAVGRDVTNEQDQRDQLIQTLRGNMDITTFQKPDGAIAVYSTNGQPLVDNTVATISVAGNQILATSPPSAPVAIRVTTGTLGGLQVLQNTTLPGIQSQLDDFARGLTVEFNNINVPLFNDGGSAPLLGSNPALPISVGNPVNPVQLSGYAARIAVNSAIIATPTILRDANSPTPLAPGDTTNINAALNLFNSSTIQFNAATGLDASGSFVQVATDFIAAQSSLKANAQSALTSEQALQQTLANKVSAQSGVNVDDEVAQLAQLQNSYSANARVLQTSQNLFNTLFNSLQ